MSASLRRKAFYKRPVAVSVFRDLSCLSLDMGPKIHIDSMQPLLTGGRWTPPQSSLGDFVIPLSVRKAAGLCTRC